MLVIRRASDADFDAIWEMFHEVVQGGETYPFAPETTKEEAYQIWMQMPTATYVAVAATQIVGTYYLKPNQPGLGSHVCNAGSMVKRQARGQGVGRAMGLHSLSEARQAGFRAMQFNRARGNQSASCQIMAGSRFCDHWHLAQSFQEHPTGFGRCAGHVPASRSGLIGLLGHGLWWQCESWVWSWPP